MSAALFGSELGKVGFTHLRHSARDSRDTRDSIYNFVLPLSPHTITMSMASGEQVFAKIRHIHFMTINNAGQSLAIILLFVWSHGTRFLDITHFRLNDALELEIRWNSLYHHF